MSARTASLVGRALRPLAPGRGHDRLLARSERCDPAELEALRLEALRGVLLAARRVPFHRRRMEAAGVAPESVASLGDLALLPALEREDLQAVGWRGLAVPGARGARLTTSGTVGTPVEVVRSREAEGWWAADDRRANAWLGVRPGDRQLAVATLAAGGGGRLLGRLRGVRVLPAAALADPAVVARLARALDRRPVGLVRGLPELLASLAEAMPPPRRARALACRTGGGSLLAPARAAIERGFGCTVHERYGALEVRTIAHRCPEAAALHVAAERIVVELVRDDGAPAAPGELAHVLVTDLRNHAFPLLRYRVGDLARAPAPGSCPCGRTLPLFGELVGRPNAILVGADGRAVVPQAVAATIDEHGPGVLRWRVVQQPDRSLALELVQRDGAAAERVRAELAHRLDALLAEPGATTARRVDAIPLSGAGKLEPVVSRVGAGPPVGGPLTAPLH